MIAVNIDFLVRVTEPFYVELALSIENVGLIDFTGEDVRMHVRETYQSNRALLELSTANQQILVLTPALPAQPNNLALSVPIQETMTIPVGNYVYDLRYWDGPVLLYGAISFKPGVTR